MTECWRRLDEKFADRVGAIRSVLRNLMEVDLSKGKHYEKIERLDFEIQNAQYLLRELQADQRLSQDLGLVGTLLKKLPPDFRKEWVKWSSSQETAAVPGETEWGQFLVWLQEQRKAGLADRWYDEADSPRLPPTQPKFACSKCGSRNHRTGECRTSSTQGSLSLRRRWRPKPCKLPGCPLRRRHTMRLQVRKLNVQTVRFYITGTNLLKMVK